MKNKRPFDLSRYFPALTHRDFRIFWFGQIISLHGTWMQRMGQAWLVYEMTGSPFKLGLIGTLQFLPVMFFSLFAGVIVDRWPKKKLIIFTQTCASALALILSVLVFTNTVAYWHILILAFILGFINALDMPARQSFIIELASPEHLMNAIALNSTIFNFARIVGPALAGIVIDRLGASWCFLLNGISYWPVIYGLFIVSASGNPQKIKHESYLKTIADGFSYVRENRILKNTILMLLVISTFAYNFDVLLPVLAKTRLGLGDTDFTFFMSAIGLGAFLGSIYVATQSKLGPKSIMMISAAILLGVMQIAIGMSTTVYVTVIFLFITGILNISFTTTANSTIQLASDNAHRGRVMSFYSLVFAGAAPVGNFLSGSVAQHFGAHSAYVFNGLAILVFIGIILIWISRKLKKIIGGLEVV